jgi:hypothetical protein
MTREEFESILEEAFLEGYNNAIDEIEEILDEDYIDIEDDYEVYDEDAHKRVPSFTKSLIKHAKIMKDGRRYLHDLKKAGISNPKKMDMHDPKTISMLEKNPKAIELTQKYMSKGMEKSMNPKLMGNYMKSLEDKQKGFEKGTLKDLKTRLVLNRARNAINKLNEND